jgi:hypothetical protein
MKRILAFYNALIQHFNARLPPLDPASAKSLSYEVYMMADRTLDDPRDPTQTQQYYPLFILVLARAINNLPVLAKFADYIHSKTQYTYWTEAELLQPLLQDVLQPAVRQLKFNSQMAHLTRPRLTNGGDYMADGG